MAKKTTNARLGLLGEISILGTTGIVKPFHRRLAGQRGPGDEIAAAAGERMLVLTTGGKSEQYAMVPSCWDDGQAVQDGQRQDADACGRLVGGYGIPRLAGPRAGRLRGALEDIRAANTARHVLDLCREAGLIGIATLVCHKVAEHCTGHAGGGFEVWACLAISGALRSGVTRRRFHKRHAGGILSTMMSGLETGFILDRQWFRLQGEMERTKRLALLALARVLADTETSYAIIGGVALQTHQAEPRTTLDIDVAVAAYGDIPRGPLQAAGFVRTGRFPHSENWVGPEGTPVQFTADPALLDAILRAEEIELETVRLRVISRTDLLHEKLRSASDPARRRSKRLQDLADAHALLESTPTLGEALTPEERGLLEQLPQ